jgi:DNA polymerase-3 subunit alpha
MNLSEVEDSPDNRKVVVGGILGKVKIQVSRAGKQFAILPLEDFTGSAEILIFSDVVEKRRMILKEGNAVVVFGAVSARDGEQAKIKGDDLTLLEAVTREFPVSLKLKFDSDIDSETRQKLLAILGEYNGNSELYIESIVNDKRLLYRAGKQKVDINVKLLKQLKGLLGSDSVALVKPRNGFPRNNRNGDR